MNKYRKKLKSVVLLIILWTNKLLFCIEPDVAKYFNTNIDYIETEYKSQLLNNKNSLNELTINDKNTIEFLITIDCISDLNLLDFHNTNKLKIHKFNLLKDWYFLNKDKLSMDLINEAIALNHLLLNDYYFIFADTTTYDVRYNNFVKRLKRRNIDRGLKY